jgi:hypothetical protein
MAAKRAAMKALDGDDNVMTVQLPKGFDINDEASVMHLLEILKSNNDANGSNYSHVVSNRNTQEQTEYDGQKDPVEAEVPSATDRSISSAAERNLGMLENDRKLAPIERSEVVYSQHRVESDDEMHEHRRNFQGSNNENSRATRSGLYPVLEEENDLKAPFQHEDDDFIRDFERSLAAGRGFVGKSNMETYDDMSHLTDPTTYAKSSSAMVHREQRAAESRFVQSRDETSAPTRASKQKSRPKITPESIERPRQRKQPPGRSPAALQPKASKVVKPPRPDRSLANAVANQNSGYSRSKRLSPRSSPRNSPRSFVVVGGPGPRDDIPSDASDEVSRAETVASQALEAILGRIEDAKASLLSHTFHPRLSKEDIESQSEMATLIEKLASAAVAVRRLEEMG